VARGAGVLAPARDARGGAAPRAHPAFDIRNPNKVYALIRTFCANHLHFTRPTARATPLPAERIVELDAINPQVASRSPAPSTAGRKFDAGRQAHARAALERIRNTTGLSKDVLEIVTKALL